MCENKTKSNKIFDGIIKQDGHESAGEVFFDIDFRDKILDKFFGIVFDKTITEEELLEDTIFDKEDIKYFKSQNGIL